MERILIGYHLCIEACGLYKEGRYTQWYKMEIIYHSLLTDLIDMNDHKLAT